MYRHIILRNLKPAMKKEKRKRKPSTELELRQRLKELQKENEYLRTYMDIFRTQMMAELKKAAL